MAKQERRITSTQVQGNSGQGASYEHSESYDDSLLPPAEELAKLHDIDPDCIRWLKERTAIEQDARLRWNENHMGLLQSAQRKRFALDLIKISISAGILVSGMFFSYYLILAKESIAGGIFGGATLLLAIRTFLNYGNKPTNRTPQ